MAKRSKRPPKSAYLKRHKRFLDPYSPYAIRTRGARAIDLTSPIPTTITHGKRGLTIARAIHIPLVATHIRKEVIESLEINARGRLLEWNHFNYMRLHDYMLELYFEGMRWVWVERDLTKMLERRSKTYSDKERAEKAFKINGIIWSEVIPIATPPPAFPKSA